MYETDGQIHLLQNDPKHNPPKNQMDKDKYKYRLGLATNNLTNTSYVLKMLVSRKKRQNAWVSPMQS